MDKIKLREHRQRVGSRLFMVGGNASEDMYLKKKEIRLAMQGKPLEFVYDGSTRSVKPYQAKLWVEQAPQESSYGGFGYMNYLESTSRICFEPVESFESACRLYERVRLLSRADIISAGLACWVFVKEEAY